MQGEFQNFLTKLHGSRAYLKICGLSLMNMNEIRLKDCKTQTDYDIEVVFGHKSKMLIF